MLPMAKKAPRPSTEIPGSALSFREPGGSTGAGGNSPDLTENGPAACAGDAQASAIAHAVAAGQPLITTYCTPYTPAVRRRETAAGARSRPAYPAISALFTLRTASFWRVRV